MFPYHCLVVYVAVIISKGFILFAVYFTTGFVLHACCLCFEDHSWWFILFLVYFIFPGLFYSWFIIVSGLTKTQLEQLATSERVHKISQRDLAYSISQVYM